MIWWHLTFPSLFLWGCCMDDDLNANYKLKRWACIPMNITPRIKYVLADQGALAIKITWLSMSVSKSRSSRRCRSRTVRRRPRWVPPPINWRRGSSWSHPLLRIGARLTLPMWSRIGTAARALLVKNTRTRHRARQLIRVLRGRWVNLDLVSYLPNVEPWG